MTWLINLLYGLAAVAYIPLLLYQMLVHKKNRRGWREKFGFVKRRVGRKPCVWIHAVSLGEVNATRSLVAEIERRLPAHEIVISATTDTGYAAAARLYGPKLIFRYPLDFSFAVRRTLDRIRPAVIILIELEVWPNLAALARRRAIPVGIANGRLTRERSVRRFRWPVIRTIARNMFSSLDWVAAQNETYAERFVELGVPRDRVTVSGTMKYDTAVIADRVDGDEDLAISLEIDSDRPLLVAGSTGPGEEELLLTAFEGLRKTRPELQFAIIPRKPERFEEVSRLIETRGYSCRRRSQCPDLLGEDARMKQRQRRIAKVEERHTRSGGESGKQPIVLLGDTMGELRKFYALADVVFVGRSLVQMGGSDVMEVAGLATPICFGPHMENFADVADALLRADAAEQVESEEGLASAIKRLLGDPDRAGEMGRRARDVVRDNVGATSAVVGLLCQSVGRRSDFADGSISTAKLVQE